MFDWVGSLRIRERSRTRVVLGMSRSTRVAGVVALGAGVVFALPAWSIAPLLALGPVALMALGTLLMSLRRDLVIDREAGILLVDQGVLGLGSKMVVPLFHLRAAVVVARVAGAFPASRARYVAHLERRIGPSIFLDEARRCASLLALAEAIAEVAEIRLEYDAQASARG